MKNKIGIIILVVSMLLLSACGSSGSSSGTAGTDNVNTSEDTQSFVGTWSSGCVNANEIGESSLEIYSFNADGSGAYSFTEYDALDCNDADKLLGQDALMNYKIGNETIAKDGTPALEFYALPSGGENAYYSMIRLEGNILYISSSEESGRDGYSADTRENDFSVVYPYFRQ